MTGKRNFDDFSMGEIAEVASEAGLKARKESLEAGLEVLSQDPETGEFFYEKLDKEGNIVKRKLTKDEVEALKK
ncbi:MULTISPECIES: hypothetical protein [Microbulbifer]|uniref:PepSY domain-containing protein n=1 Tax=Microbulbifer celer TaxID=435905 RepID=A0ABW3U808_9GAMM|nr:MULTISPECIES: hypothetical protein [Microbulbifer]UFN56616.1 hypothetical protein LPW13_13725 [Microbulbifer celer]